MASSSTSTGQPKTTQLAPARWSARILSAMGGEAEGGGPAQVTSTPSGPARRSATRAGSASQTLRAAPAARTSSVRPARPPAIHTGSPARDELSAEFDHVGPALGRRCEGDAVGAVLLLAQLVAGAEPGDHPPGGQSLEREELRRQHRVGDEADPRHEGPEVGALPRAA